MESGSIVLPTCEVSMDPETAVELGVSWGIRHFELKTLWEDRRVPNITDQQRRQLRRLADQYGVDWPTISPGLFIRGEATDSEARRALDDTVPRSIELAHFLGATTMIIFSFRKTAGVGEPWVIEQLSKVADAAHGSGLTLAVEPLGGTYCDDAQALRRVIEGVDNPILRANLDPGNVAAAGFHAFPDAYEPVRGLVAYVHLKNYSAVQKQFMLFDQGDIDLRAQLGALKADGYRGYVAIETHTRYNKGGSALPPVAASRANCVTLQRWLAELA